MPPQLHWAKYTANNVTLASLDTNRKRSWVWVHGEGESERWAPDGLAGREVVAMAHRRAAVPTELVSQHHLWRAALRSPCSLHTHSTPAALWNSPLSFSFFQSAFFTFMLLYSDFTVSIADLWSSWTGLKNKDVREIKASWCTVRPLLYWYYTLQFLGLYLRFHVARTY